MKPVRLLSTLFISFTLITGCIDLSDSDKEAIAEAKKSFLDGYAEEENEAVGLSDARDKDYLGTTDVVESDTSGSARIGGEVAVSSLEDSTQANSLNQASFSTRMQGRTADTLTAANFTVSFINGSGVKTTITGSYTVLIHYPSGGGDPQFIIEGLGDGVNYIVEVAVTVDGEDVNLQSVAYVPPGATKSEKAVIDPISTVVAEAVQEKVTSGFFATGGDKFSQDYISDLNETMTAVIEDIIESNPEISITNFEVAITSDTGIDNLVSKLLADEEMNASLDTLEDVAVEEKFEAPDVSTVDLSGSANDEANPDLTIAREYVGRLFGELFGGDKENGEGGGGAPKIFVDFFGDKFEEGATKTVQEVFDALAAGLTPQDDPSTSGVDESAVGTPFTTAEQTAALAQFKTDFSDIYGAFDLVDSLSQQETLSDTQATQLMEAREILEDIPQMLMAIFPPNDRTTLANYSTSSTFDVPKAITMIFYVLDVYLDEGEDNSSAGGNEGGDDDFDPFELLLLYGFNPQTDGADYGGVEINWLGVHPGRMWVENEAGNGGSELDVLNAFTCVEDFLVGDNFVVDSVTLTFPTSTGTDTKTLVEESTYYSGEGDHGGDSSCYVWDTWQEQRLLEETGTYNITREDGFEDKNWNAITDYLITNGKIIDDFTSGDYVVTVSYTSDEGSDSISRTFAKKIITGLQQLNPRLTTPVSQPRHPEGNVSETEWQAYWAAQNEFVPTTFPAGAIGTIQWDAPEGLADSVPEGVIAAYNIDIGQNTNCDESGHCNGWENIFNTWEDNIQIFDTQFELPQEAKDKLVALELSDNNLYHINLGISFLDAQTGEYLGNGGWSNAQFRVGEAIDPTDIFTLTGSATNVPDDKFVNDSGTVHPASSYKVALIEESCDQTSCSNTTVLVSALTVDGSDFTYTLSPTFAQAKGTAGSWLNILMFIDEDGDDVFDAPTEANNFQGEPQFWSMNHVNFNTWGGVLRLGRSSCDNTTGMCDYHEEAVTPDTTYDGPDFDTMPEEFNGGEAAATPQ
jgi:hypothetical protein